MVEILNFVNGWPFFGDGIDDTKEYVSTLVLIPAHFFLMTQERSRNQFWLLQKQESQDWLSIAANFLGRADMFASSK